MWIFSAVVTCVLCLSACLVEASSELKCSAPIVTTVRLTINSRRNEAGHWISQYELKHGEESKNPRSMDLEVEHTTTTCEKLEIIGIKATVTATPHKAALPGYELFPGVGYYKFHPNVTTWQTAHDACVKEGAHLAMTNSEREAKVFQVLFARYPQITNNVHNDYAWLGFCETGVNGKYFTLSGENINQEEFYRWSPGEPNNDGLFDCLLVNRNTGGFADAPRSWLGSFICEQEL